MLQRIQTIYFSLVIICLGVTCTGMEFFRFVKGTEFYSFSVYGIQKGVGNDLSMHKSMPIYLTVIGLCLFSFMTLMSYKNIKRQLKWVRSLTFLYFLILIASIVYYYFGGTLFFGGAYLKELGIGYALLVAGFPFCFLAQLGVKKDKKLLDSLNRLR